MNSTRWRSLTEFIMDLSREGLVRAEDTEKGWFITWIDRSPGAAVSDAERKAQRDKNELDDAERDRQRTLMQLASARQSGTASNHVHATELHKESGGQLEFSLALDNKEPEEKTNDNGLGEANRKRPFDFDEEDEQEDDRSRMPPPPPSQSAGKKLSNLEMIAREMERNKRSKPSGVLPFDNVSPAPPPPPALSVVAEGWLVPGIVVKVMNKKLGGGAYYKKKGLVFEVHNGGTVGDVEIQDESQDAIRVTAALLETVIPSIGGRVAVVQGSHRGQEGTLLALRTEEYAADVRLASGAVVTLPYESICKMNKQQ